MAAGVRWVQVAYDLDLGDLGEGVPDGGRREAVEGRVVRKLSRQRERPADAILVNDVADKAGHRNTAVLNLGVPEEADRCVLRLLRKGECLGQPHWVPEADGRVEILGERLEVRDRIHAHVGAHGDLRRDVGRSSGDDRQHLSGRG